jgi:membrane protease YdiL (CAAX protease family)
MYRITLPTKRPFNWKALWVLLAMLVVAAPIVIPFSLTLTGHQIEQQLAEAGVSMPVWLVLFINVSVVNFVLAGVLGALGLLMASRIGLGMPFIEGWTNKQPIWNRLPRALAIAIIAGLIASLVIAGLDLWVFGPGMKTLINSDSVELTGSLKPPAWQGFLAAINAGITEETMFRLFGLTLLAWISHWISCDEDGRPTLAALWIANIVFAVAFGLAHLPATQAAGLPITPLIIARAITLNGVIGLTFGWLYWRFGLETAMFAHFFGDIVLHVLLTLAGQNSDNPVLSNGYLIGGLVLMAAIAAALWWFGPKWTEEPSIASDAVLSA